MIIVLLAIFIVICIISQTQDSDWGIVLSATAIVICVFAMMGMAIVYPYNIEPRIALYVEENAKIEEKIKATVQVYMNYEKDTYTNLIENADLTTLLIAYPELNSNELVKAEIDTYIRNSNQIKALKEEKILKSTFNWWLYLGR